ncbi:putative HNHc nuclease [Lacrimispora sp. NSJ-141]|uniref:HNHc nuclease n=1 Tax=Lientehia hominis TaxID=2897778 RepID=A0AAP2RJQ4_9FIRM|nr:putative HNHc nuclease [Lientehia hominis]MCD2492754.1 putative HNHc nuclease [Lientehia hominis]
MQAYTVIKKYRETKEGTDLVIHIPDRQLGDMIAEKRIRDAEIRMDDGRHISAEQRRKAYATINDIAMWMGDAPEAVKEWMKYRHICRTGDGYFSLSDCTMDTAREFINTLLDFCLEQGVPLGEYGAQRTDDIGKYLWCCLKYKKCAVCGRPGEVHHWDAVGMGNDRTRVDDSGHRKICLCREHHTAAHSRGNASFEKMYHVYGILYPTAP